MRVARTVARPSGMLRLVANGKALVAQVGGGQRREQGPRGGPITPNTASPEVTSTTLAQTAGMFLVDVVLMRSVLAALETIRYSSAARRVAVTSDS